MTKNQQSSVICLITKICKKKKRTLLVISLTIASFFSFVQQKNGLVAVQQRSLSDEGERENTLRDLSLYLGDGKCKWQPPIYDVPDDIIFQKTLIAGYPSGDKRLTFVQMEALTGLSARDEWDFAYLGPTNQPFIKANYPHHEGIWGWGNRADHMLMVVRNIRRSMVEYHDILWDIGYAETFEEAYEHLDRLYAERPPLEDFLGWRDERVMDEIHWYGWFIDYWMEQGLMRCMFTHNITTAEHWNMLMQPTRYTKAEMAYDLIVGDQVVTPTYDPHCLNDVSGASGCFPVEIISGEHLVDHEKGPAEGRKIAKVIQGKTGVDEWLIPEDAWECIWEELILNKKGLKTFIDRPGLEESDYNFSSEMLEEMLKELDRLITKYGQTEWETNRIAEDLIKLLSEHRALIQTELEEVLQGVRELRDYDFLGPKTRRGRALTDEEAQTASRELRRHPFEEPEKIHTNTQDDQ